MHKELGRNPSVAPQDDGLAMGWGGFVGGEATHKTLFL